MVERRRVGVEGLDMAGRWRRVRYGVGLGVVEGLILGLASWELGMRSGGELRGVREGVFMSAGSGELMGRAWLDMTEEIMGLLDVSSR